MALPRYQRANIATQAIGRITPVAAQEEARTAETLSRALDRVSSFAFRQAEVVAQIEGEEYGAEKAPSAQQLQDAFDSGENIEEFIPGDTMTVFGRSARSSAIKAVSNSFEATARQDIAQLSIRAEAEGMSIDQFQVEMADLIDGYAAPLLEISPSTSRRFRAATSVVGNAAVQSHASFLAKQAAKQAEVNAILDIDETINTHLPKVIANGSTTDPISLEVTPLSDHIEFYRNKIIESGINISDKSILDSKLKAFDDAVSQQFNTQVSKYVMEDPLKRFAEIRTGVISDPTMQDIFGAMTEEQRVNAYDNAMDVANRDLTYANSLEASNERLRGELVNKLRPDLVRARARGDTEEVDRIIDRIEELEPETAAQLEEEIYTQGGIDSAEAIFALEQLSAQGTLTYKDIGDARKNGLLTYQAYDRFVSKLQAQNNEDHQEAMTFAKNALGYPDRAVVNLVDDDRIALQRIAEIENELIIQSRKEPDFDRLAYVQQRVKDIKEGGPSDAQISASRRKVVGLRKLFGLPADTPLDQLATELDKRVEENKFNAGEAATYRSAIKMLENNQ